MKDKHPKAPLLFASLVLKHLSTIPFLHFVPCSISIYLSTYLFIQQAASEEDHYYENLTLDRPSQQSTDNLLLFFDYKNAHGIATG